MKTVFIFRCVAKSQMKYTYFHLTNLIFLLYTMFNLQLFQHRKALCDKFYCLNYYLKLVTKHGICNEQANMSHDCHMIVNLVKILLTTLYDKRHPLNI